MDGLAVQNVGSSVSVQVQTASWGSTFSSLEFLM